MILRKTIFWIHLGVGVTAAVVILMMSVTGVILTCEMQLNVNGREVPEPGSREV